MKKIVAILAAVSSLFILGCGSDSNTDETTTNLTEAATTSVSSETTAAQVNNDIQEGELFEVDITSKAISNNIIGDSPTKTIQIYLPPSYDGSDKKYPVVYFLQGYDDSNSSFMNRFKSTLDKAFSSSDKEFILVSVDGNNVTGGSFYVNSPVTGNWEDYITQEVVDYIDSNYRTLADSDSRSISGMSMGGFGAINLGLKHPDIYSSVIVFCPGLIADGDLDSMWDSWEVWPDTKQSYAQSFSPNTEDTVNYGNIPVFDGSEEDNKVIEQWIDGYGNLENKVEDYLSLNTPLKCIQLNYSDDDTYVWVPGGCASLTNILNDNNINNSVKKFPGGHLIPSDCFEDYLIPFFDEYLAFE